MPAQNEALWCVYVSVYECEPAYLWNGQGELFLWFLLVSLVRGSLDIYSMTTVHKDVKNLLMHLEITFWNLHAIFIIK